MNIEYREKGIFFFKKGDSLRAKTKNIPSGYGVYIFRKNIENGDILYIGKGGTVSQNGSYKSQDLRKRLQNKQDGRPREQFLNDRISEDDTLKAIVIEWYIIDEAKYLPGFIEAKLIQNYYAENACLPIWNHAF